MKKILLHALGLFSPVGLVALPSTLTLQHCFWANYYHQQGDYQKANAFYQDLFKANPAPHAYKGYLQLLHDMGNFQEIFKRMPSLEATFKNDPAVQLLFAQTYEKLGLQKQFDEKVIALAQQFKTHQEIIFQAAQILVQRKEPENALKVIDDFLNHAPARSNNFIFHFLKAQINLHLNKHKLALKNVRQCLEIHPHFDKGWLLSAILEEQCGTLDKATQAYTNFLTLAGGNKEIEQRLLQLTYKQKIGQQKTNTLVHNTSWFQRALSAYDRKEYSNALNAINKSLEEKPQDKEGRLLKIQILGAQDAYAQAANDIKEWINQNPSDPFWYSVLHLLCKVQLPYPKAIAVLEDIALHHPTTITPFLYLADIHIRSNHKESALMYQEKALELAHDAPLKAKLFFQRGVLYYDMQNFDAMKQNLEQSLVHNPTFLPALNLLAYYHATRGQDLEKAQTLISLVLEQQGTNPHFLDTQAVIFYKQKNYTQAAHVLNKALKIVPQDATIARHLSKVYYKMGNNEKAFTLIKEALSLASHETEKIKCGHLCNAWNVH